MLGYPLYHKHIWMLAGNDMRLLFECGYQPVRHDEQSPRQPSLRGRPAPMISGSQVKEGQLSENGTLSCSFCRIDRVCAFPA
jgi:hypothetical protein